MCDEDEFIELDPKKPSTSKWCTGVRTNVASSSETEHLWVLKAGSAYYHFPDRNPTNHWVHAEVDCVRPSLHTSGTTCSNEASGNYAMVDKIRSEKLTDINKDDIIHELCIFNLKRPNLQKRNPVLRFDIKRILNGWCLNDAIINNYIGMLNLRIRDGRTFIMDTYHMAYLVNFKNMLEKENAEEHIQANIKERNNIINNWGFNLKDYDLILIPVHSRHKTHWELWVIDLKFKIVRIYDSKDCGAQRKEDIEIITAWVNSIWKVRINERDIVVVSKRNGYNIPSQGENNAVDCGVFMLKYMESVISGKPLCDMRETFNDGDSRIKKYRTNLARELLCN